MKKRLSGRTIAVIFLLLASASWLVAQKPMDPAAAEANKLMQKGKFTDAEALMKETLAKNKENGEIWFTLGLAQHFQKHFKDSRASWEKALELGFEKATTHYNIACASSLLGDLDKGFEHLEKSIDAGFRDPKGIKVDPDLTALRADKRWEAVMAKLN